LSIFVIFRQVSNSGYSGYQPAAPSSVVKVPVANGYGNAHGAGYGKAYDNNAYEKDHRDLTAGGVRVLPSAGAIDHQARRTNNYDNSGYY
jgi:hypothetical protein